MSIKRKLLLGVAALLVLAVAVIVGKTVQLVSLLSLDRDQAYQQRLVFLWDYVNWNNDRPDPTLDPSLLEYFGSLYNPLMEKGPSLVAYPLEKNKAATAVLVIPGGGYGFRSEKLEGVKIAKWLNEQGIAAFILNYRLGKHPEPVNDARLAISYLRKNSEALGIHPEKIGSLGFSAGGHLAASLANLYDRVDALGEIPSPFAAISARPDFNVLAYPVITFEEPHMHQGSRENLIGELPSDSMIELLSAEKQVSVTTPPTFVWAPKTDQVVPYQNAEIYSQALSKKGVENELHLFEEGRHGSDLAQDEVQAGQWPGLMLKWLDKTIGIDTPVIAYGG